MSHLLNGNLIYINKLNDEVIKEANLFLKDKTDLYTKKKDWNCDVETTKDSHLNILNAQELLSLKLDILKHCDYYMRDNLDFYDGYIDCSWFNKYKKDFYQEFHRHNSKVSHYFSGVIYLTDNNSEIHFFINNTFKYAPKKGDIVIFDSNFEHRVVANKNDSLRISLAFNFKKCFNYD